MEFGKIIKYKIVIDASSNQGFLVSVGCVHLAYSNKKDLLRDLEEYLDDPDGFEKEYDKGAGGATAEEIPQQVSEVTIGQPSAER